MGAELETQAAPLLCPDGCQMTICHAICCPWYPRWGRCWEKEPEPRIHQSKGIPDEASSPKRENGVEQEGESATD